MSNLVTDLAGQFEIQALFVDVDVTSSASVKQMMEAIHAKFDTGRQADMLDQPLFSRALRATHGPAT